MTAWEKYTKTFVDSNNQHIKFPNWKVSGAWEFERSDGLLTAHPMESPFVGPGSKRETCEDSMRLADKFIPLGVELPEGMRTRNDPCYGPLWDCEDDD